MAKYNLMWTIIWSIALALIVAGFFSRLVLWCAAVYAGVFFVVFLREWLYYRKK